MAKGTGELVVSLQQAAPIPLDCTFRCAPGELLALVGPSGSGKTTALRCIAGLHHPARGSVACGGDLWFDAQAGIARPPQQRRVGFVFQHYALLPHLTAAQNVALGLDDLPPADRHARAAEWLARVRLDGLEARRPAQLSGGQQQRVALARALARATSDPRRPGVLLLDEPFAAVDQVTRQKLRTELARLRADLPLPVVMVTHDLEEARALADTLVVLHRGQALQAGATTDVMARPRDATVARLLGLTNVFSGTVVAGGDGLQLAWGERRLAVVDFRGLAPGTAVDWVIPAEGVLLHRPDRPAAGDAENPVQGIVSEAVRLGSYTQLTLALHEEAQPLSFLVSSHAVERNRLGPGRPAGVTLLARHIHLMPRQLS